MSDRLRVTILGCGSSPGAPRITGDWGNCDPNNPRNRRMRTAVLVERIAANGARTTVVIDTGPDFRQQMLREDVKSVEAVLFTHEHKDHTAGFDDIRAFNFINRKKMDVYASERVQQAIRREFAYIFSDVKYPGIPEINLYLLENKPTEIHGVSFLPVKVMHHRLPVFGFRVGGFSYITDANYISETEKEKIKGSKVLVINALRREEHLSHFTFQQAIDLSAELKAEMTYFTHISHQLGKHADVEDELPPSIRLAYDGLQLEIA